MKVPPGIRERDFAGALQQFSAVVGEEWVFSGVEDVTLYRDAYSLVWGERESRLLRGCYTGVVRRVSNGRSGPSG
jgi:(+)-pinoresinol hydroxylase